MARPKIPIDPEHVRKLAERLWTTEEIAAFLKVSRRTIDRHFGQVMSEGRHSARTKLKDHLWVRALGGRTKEGILVPASDRMFEHALNRFLGAIPQHQKISLADIPDDQLIPEIERRVKNESKQE